MKSAFILCVFLIFLTELAHCQSLNLLNSEHVWRDLVKTSEDFDCCTYTHSIKFFGDTVLKSIAYKKVLQSDDSTQTHWQIIGFVREDLNKGLYYKNLYGTQEEQLLYNYNLELNDTVKISNIFGDQDSSFFIVSNIENVFVDGSTRKKYLLVYPEYHNFTEIWIESIGSLSGILREGFFCLCNTNTLLCCSNGEELIYKNPDFDRCYYNSAPTIQPVFPSVKDHPEWKVQRSIEPSLPGPVFIMNYHFVKDTTINQKTYSLVSRTGNQQPHLSYERVGFVRSDSKKVFFKKSADGKEYLLYDFGLQVGDAAYFPFLETDSAKYKVLNVDSVNVNGIKRLRLKVLPEYYPEEYMSMYWIEGIGSLWNPFYHDSFGVGGKSDEVRCVSMDVGQLYTNPNYDDCATVLRKTDCIVNEGFVWSGMSIYKELTGKDSIVSYHIKFAGDTILNDRTYTKIWQSNDSLGVNWNMTGLIREVEKRVYYHKLNDDEFYDMLLYDFSVKTGNSLLLSSIESPGSFESMKVTNVDSIEVNGEKRLRIQLSDGTDSDTWIEKIGSLQGIINHCYFEPVSIERILLCVKQDGEMIYSNDAYPDCFYTQSSFPTFATDLKNLKINIFPNPFTNEITIEYSGAEQFTIEILNSGGQKVLENNVSSMNRFQVNLSAFPAGVYFVKAITGKKVMVQKIIKH